MRRPEAFNPSDPFDVVSEHFRSEICEVAARMLRDPVYQRLPPVQQLEAFMWGSLVGVIGLSFAHIEEAGRDALMQAIIQYLPQARAQAEAISEEAGRQTRQ